MYTKDAHVDVTYTAHDSGDGASDERYNVLYAIISVNLYTRI